METDALGPTSAIFLSFTMTVKLGCAPDPVPSITVTFVIAIVLELEDEQELKNPMEIAHRTEAKNARANEVNTRHFIPPILYKLICLRLCELRIEPIVLF